jgi:electron transfer flavoprotein beta subunit
LNIVVCVKQILDPEIPPAKFRLDAEAKKVVGPEGLPPVINPYDAQAVELALRLKDRYGAKVMVISLGAPDAAVVVKQALSMGADEGVLISDAAFAGADSFAVAGVLGATIRTIRDFDLILCGRQAADWDEGLVGPIMAEQLGLPLVNLAEAIDLANGELIVRKVLLDGRQVLATKMPALVTVSNEVGRPRLPSGWGIISASRKKIPVWNAQDIKVEPEQIRSFNARRKLKQLGIPERARRCQMIAGESPAELASKLANNLREKGLL